MTIQSVRAKPIPNHCFEKRLRNWKNEKEHNDMTEKEKTDLNERKQKKISEPIKRFHHHSREQKIKILTFKFRDESKCRLEKTLNCWMKFGRLRISPMLKWFNSSLIDWLITGWLGIGLNTMMQYFQTKNLKFKFNQKGIETLNIPHDPVLDWLSTCLSLDYSLIDFTNLLYSLY